MRTKEILINFLTKKHELIHRTSKIVYITKSDIKEIEEWSDEECDAVLRKMVDRINNGYITDNTICPWCMKNETCDTCGYGKRHGKCIHDSESTYRTIIDYTYSITSIYGMADLCREFANQFKNI